MRDLAEPLRNWTVKGRRYALATVVQSRGSSPRGVGSAMAVREDRLIAGSVSGGCVEGAVVVAARRALESGTPELLEFGALSDASLWEVGLSCGGSIQVWVEPSQPAEPFRSLPERLANRAPLVWATRLSPENPGQALFDPGGAIGDAALAESIRDSVRVALDSSASGTVETEQGPVFLCVSPTPDRLVIIGAVHVAASLVGFARELGMETIVIDPRAPFAREERFPSRPDQLVRDWPAPTIDQLNPDAKTYVVALSHDPKIDDPALFAAIRSEAAFVGALGGRKTHARRRESLKRMGLSDEELERIHGPVGLDIGSATPEEIALSIAAEIVRFRRSLPTT